MPITNLSDFIVEINNLIVPGNTLWFRGHESANYCLCPSIYRNGFLPEHERELLVRFKARALPYLKESYNYNDYWAWLFLMQHHGMPTRLLDWSTSALIALGFAILKRRPENEALDAAVWCLKPDILNEKVRIMRAPYERILDISDERVNTVYKYESTIVPDYPIPITGPMNNPRIVAQKGAFTLFPKVNLVFNLEDKVDVADFLTKIIIPQGNVQLIRQQLIAMGITETSLYPELVSLGEEIKREYQELLIPVI